MRCVVAAAAAALLPPAAAGGCHDATGTRKADFPRCEELSRGAFWVAWAVNRDAGTIDLKLMRQGRGWMAVGIGEESNGGMKGADIVAVHRTAGTVVAQDMYATGFQFPVVDSKQHVRLLDFSSSGSMTVATVRRVLRSCDPQDLAIRPEFPHYLLYAFGADQEWQFGFHGTRSRGGKMFNFFSSDPLALHGGTPDVRPGTSQFPVLFPADFTVPTAPRPDGLGGYVSGENQYKCMTVPLSRVTNLTRPFDIVTMDPVIDSGLVHHMIVAGCTHDPRPNPSIPYGVDPENDMFDCPMGGGTRQCTPLGGFAAGATPFVAPEGVGVRVDRDVEWILTDTHFYNPDMLQGVADHGGMRYGVAPSLQNIVAGIVVIGLDFTMRLPHGRDEAQFAIHCAANHLDSLFGDRDTVKMMDIFQHTHNRGISSRTFVVRDGKRIPLFIQNHYDYNFQGHALIDFELRRGDALEMYCGFDTRGAVDEIRWGERTQDEMCFNTITFFPAKEAGARLECFSYTTQYLSRPEPTTWTFHSAGKRGGVNFDAINRGIMTGCLRPPAACPAALWNSTCIDAGACFQKEVCAMVGCQRIDEHPKLKHICPKVYDMCLPCYAPGEGECTDCADPCVDALGKGWLRNQTGGPLPVPSKTQSSPWFDAGYDLPWGTPWTPDLSDKCAASCDGCEDGVPTRNSPAPELSTVAGTTPVDSDRDKLLAAVVVVLGCVLLLLVCVLMWSIRLLWRGQKGVDVASSPSSPASPARAACGLEEVTVGRPLGRPSRAD
eukprot:TRINITY_DN1336_c0_g2_i2.p1 TRINITY_DN1336_c0_g2~~TRINITY_DN1336_c0_g2_i2.p1  ORF type:complete len:795 (+),score=152.96 TRINITY_DN1336_c0_g2_i2:69-2387(+)